MHCNIWLKARAWKIISSRASCGESFIFHSSFKLPKSIDACKVIIKLQKRTENCILLNYSEDHNM